MTNKQKKTLYRIIVGTFFFISAIILKETEYLNIILFFAAYFIIGGDVLLKAIRNILKGQIFDENFLMCVATIGAFLIKEYPEGVAVMLFYQVGELFQGYAVNRSRTSISTLMDIRPDYANIEKDGEIIQVDPEEIEIGQKIIVKPGEKIPLDGIVVQGASMVDTKALTGEAVPRSLKVGAEALSGCINQNGLLTIEVTKIFEESTVSKILDLVENASSKKAKAENFITKFARYYTPMVVCAAVLVAVIPPLLLADAVFSDWLHRALIFLVVSCPCALVISIPLSFFGGIGGTSKCGILVKGSNYLEALADTQIVVFDKTGTLTKGTFNVVKIQAVGFTEDELIETAALCESYSSHPIAGSLKRAYGKDIDNTRIENPEEISGHGIKAGIDGNMVIVGNQKLMSLEGIKCDSVNDNGTVVYVAVNHEYAGYIVIADELKDDAKDTIKELKKMNCKTVMLTGDRKLSGESVAKELGIDEVYTELLPADKVERMEELLTQKSPNGKLAFVGDGINDAPVLARADIGIAMGGLGSDAAIEAADVVIMDDKPFKIKTAVQISQKTLRIVKQNIIFALGIKGIVLILSALGMSTMWEAVFADVGVSVIAILNASRALQVKKYQD